MKEVLVLGIGNQLMMDDGIGVHVVEALSCRNTNSSVRYVVGETDIDYCLQQIRETSYIIIIDATCFGNKFGAVSVIPLHQASGNLSQSISVHEAHFLNEIKLISTYIEGIFIGIEPYKIDYSMSLSPVLQEQFLDIVNNIENIVEIYVKNILYM